MPRGKRRLRLFSIRKGRIFDRLNAWPKATSSLEEVKKNLADVEKEIRQINEQVKGRPVKVMDLGCGNGAAAKRLAELFGDSIEITGAGVSRHPEWKGKPKNLRWRVVHAEQLAKKFPPSHFDYIYSNYGLYHASDLEKALGHAKKILRPGGRLVFNLLEEEKIPKVKGLTLLKCLPAPSHHKTVWLKKE